MVVWPNSAFKSTDMLADDSGPDWERKDTEIIQGYYNTLRFVSSLNKGMAKLRANPPVEMAEIIAVFEPILHADYFLPPA